MHENSTGCTTRYMTSHSDVGGMWHLKDNLFSLLPFNKEPVSKSSAQYNYHPNKKGMNPTEFNRVQK